MPRIVSNKDLIARGARLSNGDALAEYQKPDEPVAEPVVAPEPSPVVAAPTIDVTPMKVAVETLAAVVGEAMNAQTAMLRTIVARPEPKPAPRAWEFHVVSRDGDGRIERISAKAGE